MKRLSILTAIGFVATTSVLWAQAQQPYPGFEARPIKALSEQQVADLKAGRGMGFALTAELNGYPGPVHVLELAEPLELSEAQRARTQAMFEAMKAETVPLGEKLIAQETDLDRQFADRTIAEATLASTTQAISATQAALRAAHLKYHLATIKVLTATQVHRYAELRGYLGGPQAKHQPGSHNH